MVSLCVRTPEYFVDAKVYASRMSSCKIIRLGIKIISLDCMKIMCLSGLCVCWAAPQWGPLITANSLRHPFMFVYKNWWQWGKRPQIRFYQHMLLHSPLKQFVTKSLKTKAIMHSLTTAMSKELPWTWHCHWPPLDPLLPTWKVSSPVKVGKQPTVGLCED